MALTKIGSSGITSNALTSLAVADGTIQAVDLADSSVTNDKLAGSITSNKITSVSNTAISGNIISSQITSVANTQITGLINTAQIANAAITTALIANNSIITEDIVDRAITSAKLANTAVTAGSYGGSAAISAITVDAQGRVTSASNVAFSGYSGPQGLEVFNAPGTFTLPPGITSVRVTAIGGGGGCGNGTGESPAGTRGGDGGRGIKVVTGLTGPVAVTVGNGGNQPGGAGNSTTFGPFVTATGGNGGVGWPGINPHSAGNPGTSPASTINTTALSALGNGFELQAGIAGGTNLGVNGAGGRVIVEY